MKSLCDEAMFARGHVVDELEKCGHVWGTACGNQETLEALGIRVKSNPKRLSLTLGVTVQYNSPWLFVSPVPTVYIVSNVSA